MVDGNQLLASLLADEYVAGVSIGIGQADVQDADLVHLMNRESTGPHVLAASRVDDEGLQ